MQVLKVSNLCKAYDGFKLNSVSFELQSGKITGFIGRNGAGKTTTLKSLLNFVHPDCGEVSFFGMPFSEHEDEIKQRIGFVCGGIDYYPKKKIRIIAEVSSRFFRSWDGEAFKRYCEMFKLDGAKTPEQLSAGMRVKFALALALSHHAELLILDEPTSGLDPVSRDELLDVFLSLARDEGISILFSTHITSDLDRCADDIIYIKNGNIVESGNMDGFTDNYRVVTLSEQQAQAAADKLIGCKRGRVDYEALIKTADLPIECEKITPADLEAVMIHMEKE